MIRTVSQSYRDSHREKGPEYQELFTAPHTAMVWRMERTVLQRIVDEFLDSGIDDYLDFACGTGRVLGFLSARARSATGVDVSESMLEVARKNAPGAELICADITRDHVLRERSFDLITAFRFFPNAEDDLRVGALRELASRLRSDGVLVFNNHINAGSLAIRLARLRGRESADPTTRIMSRREVENLVAAAGLGIVREYPIASLPLSNRHMIRPVAVVESVERVLGRIPMTRSIAQNIVYVCRAS